MSERGKTSPVEVSDKTDRLSDNKVRALQNVSSLTQNKINTNLHAIATTVLLLSTTTYINVGFLILR